jgi:hypothetical protein
MDQTNSPADQMAKTVFWVVMFATVAFVVAAYILVR